jgi:hypothetical protein
VKRTKGTHRFGKHNTKTYRVPVPEYVLGGYGGKNNRTVLKWFHKQRRILRTRVDDMISSKINYS